MNTLNHLRPPEAFNNARLAASDFDQTMALTFRPAPSGIGVHEAHAMAIEDLYGVDVLEQYNAAGGLRNRAAPEIVRDLFPDMPIEETALSSERLINRKLSILLEQINGEWPEPTEGFAECWSRIMQARAEGTPIDTAVISAGHAPFIRRTFDVWGLPQPDVFVTSETLDGINSWMPPEHIQKPAPLSMTMAMGQWTRLYGQPGVLLDIDEAASRTVYAGDDAYKDGKLAEHFGIPFVHIDPENAAAGWNSYAVQLGIGELGTQGSVVYDTRG